MKKLNGLVEFLEFMICMKEYSQVHGLFPVLAKTYRL